MGCCEELAAQISALNGKLNNLPSRSDLENIASRLANLEARVNSLQFQNQSSDNQNKVDTKAIAQQAAGIVLGAPLAMGLVNNSGNLNLLKEGLSLEKEFARVAKPVADNTARLARVEGLLARMMPLLGLVNLAGTLASLAEGYAANEIQGQRNDAAERAATSLGNEISKLYTLITPMKRQLDKLNADMSSFNSFKAELTGITNKLTNYYEKLYPKANDALYAANKANEKIGHIQPILDKAAKQANDSLYSANRANEKIASLIQRIADDELKLDITSKKANDGLYAGNRANEKITDVITRISADEDKLSTAYQRGNDALYEVRKLEPKLSDVVINISTLEKRTLVNEGNIETTKTTATEARKMANDALYAGNRANQKIAQTQQDKIILELSNQLSTQSSQLQQVKQEITQTKQTQKQELSPAVDNAINDIWNQINITNNQTKQQTDIYYGQVQELQQKVNQQQQVITGGLNAQIQTQVGQLQGQINQLKVLTPNNTSDSFIAQVQSQITQLKSQINDVSQNKQIQSQIDQLKTQLTAKPDLTPTEIQQLKEQIKNPPKTVEQKDVDLIKDTLKRIEAFQPLIPGLIIPAIAATPMKVGDFSPSAKSDLEAAATTGVCKSTQTGGCMRKALDPIENGINKNGNTLDKINAGLSGINAGMMQAMNNTVNAINGKLGPAIPGGIGTVLQNLDNGFNAFAKWSQLDRLLGILNLWVSVHNAYMLSSNLMQTLFSTMDTVLSAFGLAMKDHEGHDIGIGQLVGNSFEQMMRKVFGVEEWKLIKAEVAAANRIYQSAINVVYSITSILDATRNILEVVGSYVGKIGNALKKSGTVLEKSYSWMHTDLTSMTATSAKWEKLYQDIQNTETIVSSVGMVAGDVVSIKDTVKQMKDTRKEVEEDIKKIETGKGLVEDEGKLNSEAPVSLTDATIGGRDADKENP